MQRSPATRGKIITEKVAAVLADGKKPLQLCYSPGKVDDHFVYSSVLKKHIDQVTENMMLHRSNEMRSNRRFANWKFGDFPLVFLSWTANQSADLTSRCSIFTLIGCWALNSHIDKLDLMMEGFQRYFTALKVKQSLIVYSFVQYWIKTWMIRSTLYRYPFPDAGIEKVE